MSSTELEIVQFPCLGDNYGFLVHDPAANVTATIDTPDVGAIEAALKEKGWTLTDIFNTHHHPDHAGGNTSLKASTGCTVTGADNDAHRIPAIDVRVADGDTFEFGGHKVHVLEVPGHTSGHIAFWIENASVAFVGDALFALGCGRVFEGTPPQMWDSLQKLMALPDETVIYCAHEYTQSNAAFAMTVEPQNEALVARVKEIDALRAKGEPTVPTTIALEKQTNPFLRPTSPMLQETLGMVGADPVAVFTETRLRKDNF